jgi:lysosomal acid lipase/cholesteryl ester hydrolase
MRSSKTLDNGEKAPVAVLQHGMTNSSDIWLLSQENSPALRLSEEGFDVWLVNSRGNKYSRQHTDLDPDQDAEFWNFTYIEMAMFDLPAQIDYITENTKQENVTFIAHSMGTTVGYCGIGMNPEYYKEKINLFVQLSPVLELRNSKAMFLKYFSKNGEETF